MNDCIFCNIANGDVPAQRVYESDAVVAFRDLNPVAPTHVLIVPRKHISTLDTADAEDQAVLGDMLLAAKEVAKLEGITEAGYRLVFNAGPDGGQLVMHVHAHLLGGRRLGWPPG
jgi:histidine triad (HIT) family protein